MPSFSAHVELLERFLARRRDIIPRIEAALLNVRGKDLAQSRDRRRFERLLDAYFFEAPGVPRDAASLKGALYARHVADGFEPARLDRYTLTFDPLELIPRAYMYWDATRWPGSSGRLAYATTIFSAVIVRQLELLSLRIWDEEDAGMQLVEIQQLLDQLNAAKDSVVFIDEARWLIQTAQGPLTRRLQPYFDVADRIAGSFDDFNRLEIHAAGAKLAGGHLRSQVRYRVWNSGKPADDPEVLAYTRLSNSMDIALLVRDLVPLLEQYQEDRSSQWADAIFQGLSAEPDLLLIRWDLLAPCTLIEDVRMGDHHALISRYRELMGETAAHLAADAVQIDPASRAYSPLGISYGFCADLFNNVAAATLTGPRSSFAGLEDMFVGFHPGGDAARLACAEAWRHLPKRGGEREHFDHSPDWARGMFAALVRGLETRAARSDAPNASDTRRARIFVNNAPEGTASAQEYCFTTDMALAETTGAMPHTVENMLNDRTEGRFLASAETDGHWFGVSKLILTLFTAQGKDAAITNVPRAVEERLQAGDVLE